MANEDTSPYTDPGHRPWQCLESTHRAQSTAMMRVMSSVGSPTEVSTMTMVTSPDCGMPAAPMLAAEAVMLQREGGCAIQTSMFAWQSYCCVEGLIGSDFFHLPVPRCYHKLLCAQQGLPVSAVALRHEDDSSPTETGMRNGGEQIEERKPQKSIGLRHTQRWGLHLGKALDAEQWPQPWAQTMGKGQGAGCSLCDSSPSLSWLQSRGRRSLMETELEIRFRRRGSLRVAEAMVAAVGTGEGRHSPEFTWLDTDTFPLLNQIPALQYPQVPATFPYLEDTLAHVDQRGSSLAHFPQEKSCKADFGDMAQ
ncbi:hypothetical protein IHE44_0009904, partial [Lamprotornis superbus]